MKKMVMTMGKMVMMMTKNCGDNDANDDDYSDDDGDIVYNANITPVAAATDDNDVSKKIT